MLETPDPRIVVTRPKLDCVVGLEIAVEFGRTIIVDVNFLVNVLMEIAFLVLIEPVYCNLDDDAYPDEGE